MRLTLARRRDVGGSSEQSSQPRWSSAVALQGSQEEEEDRARDALLVADPGLLSPQRGMAEGERESRFCRWWAAEEEGGSRLGLL